MRILVATDAWYPQINGVVRMLTSIAEIARKNDTDFVFITPEHFRHVSLPTYPDIHAAFPLPAEVEKEILEAEADAVHIATEGPVGLMVRRFCVQQGLPFTTSFHTKFPEYVSARLPIPKSWIWAYLRWFHSASGGVMTATPALRSQLMAHGIHNTVPWPPAVDAELFQPSHAVSLKVPRPIFLTVSRLAVEKNIEAFLALDLPGSKVVVGDGPARESLVRKFPGAIFVGTKKGKALASFYAAADAFVFPSLTDTFGLVILEALASGTPVAAFPVDALIQLPGISQVAALESDLRAACLRAVNLSRARCRSFALSYSWQESTRCFLKQVVPVVRTFIRDPEFTGQPAPDLAKVCGRLL